MEPAFETSLRTVGVDPPALYELDVFDKTREENWVSARLYPTVDAFAMLSEIVASLVLRDRRPLTPACNALPRDMSVTPNDARLAFFKPYEARVKRSSMFDFELDDCHRVLIAVRTEVLLTVRLQREHSP